MHDERPPLISVIIPVRNSPGQLRQCLGSLAESSCTNYEVIVVDDASTDDTVEGLESPKVRVERLPRQRGPAAARNRGAELARGDILLFLDADVLVRPDTLSLFAETFRQGGDVDAVFGSYDTQPLALNVLSQYRNLLHHFVHQEGCEEATTFWAGCGAVRRSVFAAMGGFDASYGRPCIEDIELGTRMHKAGRRILINKQIQVTHLKRWTLWSMVKADVRDRALPWTQLILREGSMPNDLNLKLSQRLSVILSYGLLATLLVGAWYLQALLVLPVAAVAGIMLLDAWSLKRRVPTLVRGLAVGGVLAGNAWLFWHFEWLALIPLALLLGIIVLNWRFYFFLARRRQFLFAALALPLHIFYFLYGGATFGVALVLHAWNNLSAKIAGVRQPQTAGKNV